MKPVPLFDYLIKNSSKKGDIVLDIFAGSGTTVIACQQNGRKARVIELDPKYADVVVKRYVTFVETSENVYVVRKNGKKESYSEVFKEGD
jgi:DNA modification methylase